MKKVTKIIKVVKNNKQWWLVIGLGLIIVVLISILAFVGNKTDSGNTMFVKAYFGNIDMDPGISCGKVFPVERSVPKTSDAVRVSINELLKGTTEDETNDSYYTSIGPGVKIQSLKISDGTARIDFNKTLEVGVAGSCRVTAIRAQIEETLKQFPNIKNVIISIDGRTGDILQP